MYLSKSAHGQTAPSYRIVSPIPLYLNRPQSSRPTPSANAKCYRFPLSLTPTIAPFVRARFVVVPTTRRLRISHIPTSLTPARLHLPACTHSSALLPYHRSRLSFVVARTHLLLPPSPLSIPFLVLGSSVRSHSLGPSHPSIDQIAATLLLLPT